MSAILRLYPRAWRERYGDELAALLEEHPASLADHLDLIRGALDARLHPQVPGVDVAPEQEIPVNQKVLGILAAIGGLVWIVGVLTLFLLPRDPDGYRDFSLAWFGWAAAAALIGIALGEIGTRAGSATSARTGHIIAAAGLGSAGLMLMPWPVMVVGLFAVQILVGGAAVRGARNGALPPWLALAFAAGAVGLFIGSMGVIQTDAGLALASLLGLAAVLLGWSAFTNRASSPETRPA